MNFNEYKTAIQTFDDTGLSSLDITDISLPELESLMAEQDRLISTLVERGATIAGWKIVDKNDGVIISPIFDFQVLATIGEKVSREALLGTETEVCFMLSVPTSDGLIDEYVDNLDTYVAVELIRPEINNSNHSACDFYFNYGVLVSQDPACGELSFIGGNPNYIFSFTIEQAAVKKREVLKQGVLECIRRGYGGKDYFFITGTLNGLASATDSIGHNSLKYHEEVLISFDVI
ncbi:MULTISPECIES: hypothetical protein [Cobetia]|uniref:hypothetical protein n=1 Tax=Cobetia TaxID=204286 RepID=UPI0004680C8A|nr:MULTISPECIES: hypothetical protein [Cobetia]